MTFLVGVNTENATDTCKVPTVCQAHLSTAHSARAGADSAHLACPPLP